MNVRKIFNVFFLMLIFLCCFSTKNNVEGAQEVIGETVFEDFGSYSIATAGNNNATLESSYGANDQQSILNYPSNWENIKNNIPSEYVNRIKNMSGSYLEFDGTVKKAWLTTMNSAPNMDLNLQTGDFDVLIIKPDGSYFICNKASLKTTEISITQSGWYYVSFLDCLANPQLAWAISCVFENPSLPKRYMKIIYSDMDYFITGKSGGVSSVDMYFKTPLKLKGNFELFGVVIAAGDNAIARPPKTNDKLEAILDDETTQQLFQSSYNGKTVFKGRTSTDFFNGSYTAQQADSIPGGEMDIFDEELGSDYFGGKNIVGYRFTKIGEDVIRPQLIGLATEVYVPELSITTTITDGTNPGTFSIEDVIHTEVKVKNNESGDDHTAHNITIKSTVDEKLSNVKDVKVLYYGAKTDYVGRYDEVKHCVIVEDLPALASGCSYTLEYDATPNEKILEDISIATLTTDATAEYYPIDKNSLPQDLQDKYDRLKQIITDHASISGAVVTDIEIIKYNERNNSSSKQSLEGAVFSATLNSDNSKKYYSMPMNEEGHCVIENLPYGKYIIHEEIIPENSIKVSDFYVDLTSKESIYKYFIEEEPLTFAYYLENTNNEEYTMIGIQHMYGVDTIDNVNDIPNIENNFNEYFSKEILKDKNEYFEYNKIRTENELNKNINEVEDKVFNIYFDRKEYKLKFNAGKEEIAGDKGKNQIAVLDADDKLVWTETEYIPTLKVNNNEVENNEYEISAKYGEYIEPKYPYLISTNHDEFKYTFIGWMVDKESSYKENHKTEYMIDEYKILDENLILDANNTEKVHELYAVWTNTPKYYRYHYMEENLDTDSDEPFIEGHLTREYNNKYYTEFSSKDTVFNKITSENLNTHDDILGYDKLESKVEIEFGDTQQGSYEYHPIDVYIFYDRKEYTLVIHNMNDEYIPTEISSEYKDKGIYLDKVDNRIKVKYGANLSMLDELKDKWIIDKENPLKYSDESKEIYMFENWYCSPDKNEKIDYNKFNFVNYENEMINIYSKWKAKV